MKNLLFIFIFLITIFSYSQEKRLALVIGNSNYEKGELKNPVNDAKLIAKTLDSLGFDVIAKYNIETQAEFKNAIKEFGIKRESYEVGFVYYAGHGIQVKDENFMIPTKESLTSEIDVQDFGVSVKSIVRYLENKSDQVNILILDACRDNPFETTWNKTRSLKGNGLAKISPPSGTLIAYSTDTGQTAADGKSENSIYTECLSRNMLIENISLDQVFRNVRSEVLKITNGSQKPVEATQLTGQTFYLVKSNYEKQFKKAEEQIKNKEFLDALATSNFILQNAPNNVKALLLRASIYEGELNQNNKALLDYERAIQIQPNDANIYYHRTTVFENLKQYDKALSDYNKAIELAPDVATHYNYRGKLYEIELKQYEKAIADYNKAVELESKESTGLFNRAFFYQAMEQYDKSLSDYLKIIEMDPTNTNAYNNVALIYKDYIKNNEKALEFFNKKIELEPTDPLGYSNRGDLYRFNLKDNDKALLDYNKAIELAADNASNYDKRGRFYEEKLKQYDKALADYSKAIELEPKEVSWLFARAYLYNNIKQFDRALSDYLKVIEIDPKDKDVYYNTALIYLDYLKNNEKALEYLNKDIELNPKKSFGYINRGDFYRSYQIDYKKSMLDFNKAIELDSNNPEIYFYRGVLNTFNLDNVEKGLLDFNKAIELDSKNASYYNRRGILYRVKLKEYNKALDDYNYAINLDPNFNEAYTNRAILYLFNLNDIENSLINYNKAIELKPDDFDGYNYRINYFIETKNYEKAFQDADFAINKDSKKPEPFYKKALIYEAQNKYLLAIFQLTIAIQKFIENPTKNSILDFEEINILDLSDLYLKRASLSKKINDLDTMCEDYKNALESLKDNPAKKKGIELLIKENCK